MAINHYFSLELLLVLQILPFSVVVVEHYDCNHEVFARSYFKYNNVGRLT